jgi:predicted nucleic acid-binding protein
MNICTAETAQSMSKIFLDTSYAVALSARTDENHELAVKLARNLRESSTHIVTTRAVLLEIGNGLAKMRHREAAVKLLSAVEDDPIVEIVPASDDLYQRAFEMYRERVDKEWGLIDCMSFVVMSDQEITDALTADKHFQQAGFQALLLQ